MKQMSQSVKNIHPQVQNMGEANKPSSSEKKLMNKSNYNTLCWRCSKTDVKLYKCSGCRKAWYCKKSCIEEDWIEHGEYCQKIQLKRKRELELKKSGN